MSRIFSSVILVLTSFLTYGQELTATVKTATSVLPGKDLIVEITVNKPGVTGFVKYFQELPAPYTASAVQTEGGDFTNADNGAKIIWVTPPNTDQYLMSYKIFVPPSAKGTLSVGGKFSYVVGNERKIFELLPKTVTIGAESPAVKENVKPSSASTETKNEVVTNVPLDKTAKQTEEKPKSAEVKKENPVIVKTPAKIPASAAAMSTAGKTYRVQIGAFSQKKIIDGVPEPSTVQLENGMTKYFSGNFKTYEEAKKRKLELQDKGFPGAFIVSFENGVIVK